MGRQRKGGRKTDGVPSTGRDRDAESRDAPLDVPEQERKNDIPPLSTAPARTPSTTRSALPGGPGKASLDDTLLRATAVIRLRQLLPDDTGEATLASITRLTVGLSVDDIDEVTDKAGANLKARAALGYPTPASATLLRRLLILKRKEASRRNRPSS